MPGPARLRLHPALRILAWLLLGGWIGALLLCGAVVVPAAFQVSPEPRLAAHLVGRVLGPLQVAGMALGVALSALGGASGRGRWAVVLPLVLAACCAANHFAVSPAIAAIDLADPAAAPGAGVRFARLHQLSVGLFLATAGGAVLLAVLHATQELRGERPTTS